MPLTPSYVAQNLWIKPFLTLHLINSIQILEEPKKILDFIRLQTIPGLKIVWLPLQKRPFQGASQTELLRLHELHVLLIIEKHFMKCIIGTNWKIYKKFKINLEKSLLHPDSLACDLILLFSWTHCLWEVSCNYFL